MGGTLKGIIAQEQMIPNWRARFCTRMLKLDPFAAWLMQRTPATIYVGLRADEEEREGGDYHRVPDVTTRFPLRELGWGESDVMAFLDQRHQSGYRSALTVRGASSRRSGNGGRCGTSTATCISKRKASEAERGHTFRSPQRDTWPAALVDMRGRFENGHVPPRTNRQQDLFRGMQCRVCRA